MQDFDFLNPHETPEKFDWFTYLWLVERNCFFQFSRQYPKEVLELRQSLLQADQVKKVQCDHPQGLQVQIDLYKNVPGESRDIIFQMRDQILKDFWRCVKAAEAPEEEVVRTLGIPKIEMAQHPLIKLRQEALDGRRWKETYDTPLGHRLTIDAKQPPWKKKQLLNRLMLQRYLRIENNIVSG